MRQQNYFCRAKVRSPTVSDRFPLDTFGPSKNMRCAKIPFLKNCRLDKLWPDHVSDRFRPFPVFWAMNWTDSVYGRLIQCKPVQTIMLKFFRATLVRVHCPKYCIVTLITWYPIFPKNPQIPGAREIWYVMFYLFLFYAKIFLKLTLYFIILYYIILYYLILYYIILYYILFCSILL